MTRLARGLLLLTTLAALVPAVRAQEGEVKPDHSITHGGLTGLFNLVSPDTLDKGQVSFGLLHRNYDRETTDIDVGDLAASFGIGVADRLEVGMSFVANRQVDFDLPDAGSHDAFPFPVDTIDNGSGDLYAGVKYALVRVESRGNALALYGRAKFPTANEERGRGTGGYDLDLGATGGIVRGPIGLYGSAGYVFVGDARAPGEDVDLADRLQYGMALELGARSWLKGAVELTGETFVNEGTFFVDSEGREQHQEDSRDLALGFKLGGAGHGGFTLGGAYVRNLAMDDRNVRGEPSHPNGWIAELSYTSYERPVPPPPVEPTALNHEPSCSLTLTPSEVYPAGSAKAHAATASVQASDPDGDSLTYLWSATSGSVSGAGASVTWTPAEGGAEGTHTVSARVSDGKGGEAVCAATVTVKPDPELFDGRVQFEFDRYDLSEDARRVIQAAADHLRRHPELKVTLEGHCCYIATEEYNLQLGQQRAEAIRSQLTSLGVAASRVSTISYGEARPWQDNSREITRRLNRRGEFRFQFGE